ncbi:hypothetical protein AgCh_009361 [Apium graveolens]
MVQNDDVPDCYWTEEGLGRLASVIGTPLCAYNLKSQPNVLPFAKMCVQCKVGEPLPEKIKATDFNPFTKQMTVVEIPIKYQHKPKVCSSFTKLKLVDEVEKLKGILKPPASSKKVDSDGFQQSVKKADLRSFLLDNEITLAGIFRNKELASFNTSGIPSAVLGDFNTIKDLSETCGEKDLWTRDIQDFKDFISSSGLDDIRFSGAFHTWWDKRKSPITRKLDRVLGNHEWFTDQQNAEVFFTPWGLSDHSATILNIPTAMQGNNKPFQFFNFWLDHPDFIPAVRTAWQTHIVGNPMYILTQKLLLVKKALKNLNKKFGSVHNQIKTTREQLSLVQAKILNQNHVPSDLDFEKGLTETLWNLLDQEESIARQKSRVQWLEKGDNNTTFFHKKVANNWNTNKILSLTNANGERLTDGASIKSEAVNYFQSLFSSHHQGYSGVSSLQPLLRKSISPDLAIGLLPKASDTEIFNTLKSMKSNKSSGPDGFNVNFFLHTWDIAERDFLMLSITSWILAISPITSMLQWLP